MWEKGRTLTVGATRQAGTLSTTAQSGDQTTADSSTSAADGEETPVAQWGSLPACEKLDESEFGTWKLAPQEREHMHYDLLDARTCWQGSNAACNVLAAH